jgi:hypothetical protein
MLILLLLCCLAFVASAFTGSASDDQFFVHLPCVPERHAPLADKISAAFRPEPDAEWVYVVQERALDIVKQKHNSTSRVGCHATNVRDYMRQTYSVVESSLHWTNVSQSAVVLHWQGVDRKLKPVAITNNPEVLDQQDPSTPLDHARDLRSEEEVNEHMEELADVESAVGMLTAVEALVQNGYQPSRTLVLSLMLGETADTRKVSDYLHATYDKHGLEMGINPPPLPDCRGKMRAFFDSVYRGVTALFAIPATPACLKDDGEVDDDKPHFLRYVLDAGDNAALRKLPASAVSVWARVIIGAGQ